MKWDKSTFDILEKAVGKKYHSEYEGNLEGWAAYLENNGIVRETKNVPKWESWVSVGCPWSAQNNSKNSLYFPSKLAEKIVILEGMP